MKRQITLLCLAGLLLAMTIPKAEIARYTSPIVQLPPGENITLDSGIATPGLAMVWVCAYVVEGGLCTVKAPYTQFDGLTWELDGPSIKVINGGDTFVLIQVVAE